MKLTEPLQNFKSQPLLLLKPRSVKYLQIFKNLSHETVPLKLTCMTAEPADSMEVLMSTDFLLSSSPSLPLPAHTWGNSLEL
jgi:hypothetical protein